MGKPTWTRLGHRHRFDYEEAVTLVNFTGSTWSVKHLNVANGQVELETTDGQFFFIEPGYCNPINGYIQVSIVRYLCTSEDVPCDLYVTYLSGHEIAALGRES